MDIMTLSERIAAYNRSYAVGTCGHRPLRADCAQCEAAENRRLRESRDAILPEWRRRAERRELPARVTYR